jgi:hypothetical protein
MDETDRDWIQKMQLLPALPPGHHQPRFLEKLEVFGDPDSSHVMTYGQRRQRLSVMLEQRVEQVPSGRVGKRFEHRLHEWRE